MTIPNNDNQVNIEKLTPEERRVIFTFATSKTLDRIPAILIKLPSASNY